MLAVDVVVARPDQKDPRNPLLSIGPVASDAKAKKTKQSAVPSHRESIYQAKFLFGMERVKRDRRNASIRSRVVSPPDR